MKLELLREYAQLIIQNGLNVQHKQPVIVHASIHQNEMTRLCVEEAYKVGASSVEVFYHDDEITRLKYLYESLEQLSTVDEWKIKSKHSLLKKGACVLYLTSDIPDIFKDVDEKKRETASMAMSKASKHIQAYTMLNKTQWCIAAVPNEKWALQVFPNLTETEAVETLWKYILQCVRIDEKGCVKQKWEQLNENLKRRVQILNDYQFDKLLFSNTIGTNLEVSLVKHHIWCGGSENTLSGIEFHPNIPTEEIFTMPKKTGVNGIVYATRPLLYEGVLIQDFWLSFKDGKVIDYDAKEGKEALNTLIQYDEGSCFLGEVALVPHSSLISQSNILFYNTLFDENASCHLALGDAYPTTVKDGEHMDEAQLKEAGANHSFVHVDFMFGSSDMKVVGVCKDQREVLVFENGEFVI